MSNGNHSILLSGFADETTANKDFDCQLSALAALGLNYMTLRFLNLGTGVKNAMELSEGEIQTVRGRCQEFGIQISSLGSPIGKAKLRDVDDGLNAKFAPWPEYLQNDVRRSCELAATLGTRLIRGFSFYPPRGDRPENYLPETADRLAAIAERCREYELTFGLEVESNLVGQNAALLMQIYNLVSASNLVLIFDGANLVSQGFSESDVFSQYQQMKKALGWLHVKDFRVARQSNPVQHADGYVDEDRLDGYVPAGVGSSAYAQIFADLKQSLPEMNRQLRDRGIPGFFVDLEPHLRGGGQYGGYSGADGFGIALRALCRLLDEVGIDYALRDFASIEQPTAR